MQIIHMINQWRPIVFIVASRVQSYDISSMIKSRLITSNSVIGTSSYLNNRYDKLIYFCHYYYEYWHVDAQFRNSPVELAWKERKDLYFKAKRKQKFRFNFRTRIVMSLIYSNSAIIFLLKQLHTICITAKLPPHFIT